MFSVYKTFIISNANQNLVILNWFTDTENVEVSSVEVFTNTFTSKFSHRYEIRFINCIWKTISGVIFSVQRQKYLEETAHCYV